MKKVIVETYSKIEFTNRNNGSIIDKQLQYHKIITALNPEEAKKIPGFPQGFISQDNFIISYQDIKDNKNICSIWRLDNWTKEQEKEIVAYYLSNKNDK